MPQKEIRQPPCWWGSQTKMDGIPNCNDNKTFSMRMKKELKSPCNLKDRKQLLPAERYSEIGVFSYSGLFHNQIMDAILAGNLTAPWDHKYLRKWASSVSWCWTSPPFPFHFSLREKMSQLICHWRTLFAFTGIWLLSLLNKQAAEVIV